MKFGQLIEYNMRNSTPYKMKAEKLIPDPFLKNKIEHISESVASVLDILSLLYAKLRSIEVF